MRKTLSFTAFFERMGVLICFGDILADMALGCRWTALSHHVIMSPPYRGAKLFVNRARGRQVSINYVVLRLLNMHTICEFINA